MMFISWNCRGVRKRWFRHSCIELLRKQKPGVICFLETKTSDSSYLCFMSAFGYNKDYQVPTAGLAGGIWVFFWNSNNINLEIVSSTNQLIHCSFLQDNKVLYLTFVYT